MTGNAVLFGLGLFLSRGGLPTNPGDDSGFMPAERRPVPMNLLQCVTRLSLVACSNFGIRIQSPNDLLKLFQVRKASTRSTLLMMMTSANST